MVNTRSSTGNLPPPKLKSLMEDDYEMEDGYDEDVENDLHPGNMALNNDENNDTDEEDEDFDSDKEQSELADVDFKKAISTAEKLQKIVGNDSQHLTRFQRAVAGTAKTTKWKNLTDKITYYRQSKISKRNAGKLAGLMDAPLDVFVEVACYLEPLDLLHLSRVSLQMRGILMSRQARTIWKAARTAIGMPGCPDDLDEPLYASLMFEKHCNVCGTPRIQKANYVLRLRFCAVCITANIIRGTTIVKQIDPKLMKNMDIYTLIPNQQDGLRHWGNIGSSSKQFFFKPDLVDVIIKYLSFNKDSEERKKFVAEQQKRREKMIEKGLAMEKWVAKYGSTKSNAIYGITRTRKENILSKLRDNQWTDADIELLKFSGEFDTFAYQPRELTERIWKNIFPKMQALLPELRKREEQRLEEVRKQKEALEEWKRRDAERREAEEKSRAERRAQAEKQRGQQRNETEALDIKAARINNIISDLSENYHQYMIGKSGNNDQLLMPNIADVLDHLPSSLLKILDGQQLSGTEMFSIILPHIPMAADKHKNIILNRCTQLLLSTRGSVKIPDNYKQELMSTAKNIPVVLEFAWAFFQCTFHCCSHLSHYPEIVGHDHFKGNFEPNSDPSKPKPSFPFLRDHMKCPLPVVQSACKLLISLNLSLGTSMGQMNAMGQNFVCLRCSGSSDVKMTWKELVEHFGSNPKKVANESVSLQNTIHDHFSDPSRPLAARLV